jgi:phage tail P2-like protein
MLLKDLSILNILPPYLARDKNTRLALQGFDEELRRSIALIPNVLIIPNIDKIVDNLLLDLLAWQFHVDFYKSSFPVNVKRQLITRSLEWHSRKGTKTAVEELVKATLSDAKITEWFEDEFNNVPYTFAIETNINLHDQQLLADLYEAIFSMKNTRSWIGFVTHLIRVTANYYMGIGLLTKRHQFILNSVDKQVDIPFYMAAWPRINSTIMVKNNDDMVFNTIEQANFYMAIWPIINITVNVQAEELSNG